MCAALPCPVLVPFHPLPAAANPPPGHSFPYIYHFWSLFHLRRSSRAEQVWKICPVSRDVSLFKVPTRKHRRTMHTG